EVLGGLARVGGQLRVVEGGAGIDAVGGEAGVVGHERHAQAAHARHGDDVAQHGEVAGALLGGRAHRRERSARAEVQQRVGEDGGVEVVHAVQVEDVDARVGQE